MLYVLEIKKNLVLVSLLVKHGFKMVFESDKIALMKNSVFVANGFAISGMFKLNIINKLPSSSTYMSK